MDRGQDLVTGGPDQRRLARRSHRGARSASQRHGVDGDRSRSIRAGRGSRSPARQVQATDRAERTRWCRSVSAPGRALPPRSGAGDLRQRRGRRGGLPGHESRDTGADGRDQHRCHAPSGPLTRRRESPKPPGNTPIRPSGAPAAHWRWSRRRGPRSRQRSRESARRCVPSSPKAGPADPGAAR